MNATCKFDGCAKPIKARGWCGMHYERFRQHGDPAVRHPRHMEKLAWIDAAALSTSDECLDWPWGTFASGYPQIGPGRRVHAVVCEMAHGPRPDGMDAAHSCGRPICCSAAHLRWATPKENNADKKLHETDQAGERHNQAKLNWYAVDWIRSYWQTGDYTQAGLARMFGMSTRSVCNVVNGKTWVSR